MRYIGTMMTRRIFLAGLALAAPVRATGAGTTGARTTADIGVRCTGAGDADLHAALCDRLRLALATRLPARQVSHGPGTTTVTLHLSRATDTVLIGHLAWNGRQAGTGPDVTLGTRDSTIALRQYDMLVSALLKITDLSL